MNTEIQLIEKQLSDWCAETFATCFPDADLSDINLNVNASKNEQFGDYQCEAAMKLAKALKKANKKKLKKPKKNAGPCEGPHPQS